MSAPSAATAKEREKLVDSLLLKPVDAWTGQEKTQLLMLAAVLLRAPVEAAPPQPERFSPTGKRPEDVCVWMQDSDGAWDTSCGKTWEFTEAGPQENGADYCHHCGGELLPQPYSDDTAAAPVREAPPHVIGVDLGGPDRTAEFLVEAPVREAPPLEGAWLCFDGSRLHHVAYKVDAVYGWEKNDAHSVVAVPKDIADAVQERMTEAPPLVTHGLVARDLMPAARTDLAAPPLEVLKDAERYRKLREMNIEGTMTRAVMMAMEADDFDRAIDAALAAMKGDKHG